MHRKVEAGRGAGWIVDGLARLKSDGGVFASIGLLMGFLSALPLVGLLFGLMGPVFHGGLVSAFDSQRRGATPTIGQLFDGFSRPGALGRLFPLVAAMLLVGILAVIVILVTMGPAIFSLLRDGGEPQPEQILALMLPMGLAFLLLFPLAVLFGWMMFLAVPRAMLEGVSGFSALRESLAAIRANIGAFLVNFLCWIALMLVLMVPMMLLVVMFGALFGGSGLTSMLAQLIVNTLFGAVYVVVYTASMYQAWLEIHAPETEAEAGDTSVAVAL